MIGRIRTATAVVLSCALLALTACSGSGNVNGNGSSVLPTDSSSFILSRASGQDILEGVFYGEGPVAQLFPEWWSPEARAAMHFPTLTAAQHQNYVNAIHTFESELSKTDPGVFSNIKAAMTSGDPGLVQNAASRIHLDALAIAQAHSVNVNAITAKYKPDVSVTLAFQVAAVTAAVAIQAAAYQQYVAAWFAAVTFVAAVTVLVAVATPLYSHGHLANFSEDQTVALITERLSLAAPHAVPIAP